MDKVLNELEEAVLEAEGISDILGMVSDCATEGAQSLDNFKMGFWKINTMVFANVKKLKEIHDKLWTEYRKAAK